MNYIQQFNEWAAAFFKYPVRVMTNLETEVFLAMILKDEGAPLSKAAQELAQYGIFASRAKYVGLDITPEAALFFACGCDRPGTLVMYVYALKWYQVEHGGERLTIQSVAEIFPMGLPTEESLSAAWKAQKINGQNLLDMVAFAEAPGA